MKIKTISIICILMLLLLYLGNFAFAISNLTVDINDKYTIGESVIVKITSSEEIKDPSNVKITIEKPNGSTIESIPRQEKWNSNNECFDIYTVDYIGNYKINVTNILTGAEESTTFNSLMFTRGSTIVYILSFIILIASLVFWKAKKA